jgi:hypothetical protein
LLVSTPDENTVAAVTPGTPENVLASSVFGTRVVITRDGKEAWNWALPALYVMVPALAGLVYGRNTAELLVIATSTAAPRQWARVTFASRGVVAVMFVV